MSEASPDRKLGPLRDLRQDERAVVSKMLSATKFAAKLGGQAAAMKVQDMPDGGMGSVKFYNGRPRSEWEIGEQIAEAAFRDVDGVPVSVTLNIDQAGDLFELAGTVQRSEQLGRLDARTFQRRSRSIDSEASTPSDATRSPSRTSNGQKEAANDTA